MTDTEKEAFLFTRIANKTGTAFFAVRHVCAELASVLDDSDIQTLSKLNVYLLPMRGPVSTGPVLFDIPPGSNLIAVDIAIFRFLTGREIAATILHEIGHIYNPDKKGDEGEFAADDFAVAKGFGREIICSLPKIEEQMPKHASPEMSNRRIKRISQQLPFENSMQF